MKFAWVWLLLTALLLSACGSLPGAAADGPTPTVNNVPAATDMPQAEGVPGAEGMPTPVVSTAVAETGTTPGAEESRAAIWERTGGLAGVCQALTVSVDGSYTWQAACDPGEPATTGIFPAAERQPLDAWLVRLGRFEWQSTSPPGSADLFNDRYTFFGQGTQQPTAAEQEEINTYLAGLAGQAAAAAAALPTPAPGESGIRGQALVGPACPGPVQVGQECPDQPYPATFTILDASGAPVTRVVCDLQGRFQVSLPPGEYTLQPVVEGRLPRAEAQDVMVTAGQFSEVTVRFDSGIR